MISILLLLLSVIASRPVAAEASVHYRGFTLERQVEVEGSGCSHLQWTLDREAKDWILAVTSAPHASWVGIGISNNGGMKGADIAMIRLSAKGSFVVDDLFSHDYVKPEKDVVQNVELLHAEVDDQDRIRAVIRRHADTCDKDDIAVTGNKQNIICASGSVDAQGNPLFHGTQRSKALVNLLMDENLLIEREFDLDFNSSQLHLVENVVISHADPQLANAPFAIDFQMPNISLDRTVQTHYRCLAFTMPIDMNVIAFEAVWKNGTTIKEEHAPAWLHHQNIRYCPVPELIDPELLDGKPFDCYHNVPACEVNIGHAQNGRLQLPPGVHLPFEKGGTYLLTVHYDNPYQEPLDGDSSGIRVWIDPPAVKSKTKPGQISYLRANFDSIHIPADPEQKEYELQFMISSEATRAALPPQGVQIIASHSHMHLSATRAVAKLIRDGVHVSNVFETKGYDFALQAPQYNLWKLMPGDAIIMSCFYKPHRDRDIVGGWNTENEMCDLIFGLAPAVTETFSYGVGWMVKPDEPFRNSFMGTAAVGVTAKSLNYSQAIYPPNPEGRNFIPLEDHRLNFCSLAVRDTMEFQRAHWSSPELAGQCYVILMFLIFCCTYYLITEFSQIEEERKKRNTVVYASQLLFSLLALPVLLATLVSISDPAKNFNAVDPETHTFARGLIVAQSLLFLVELFYRIRIRIEVALHHLLAAGLVMLLNWAAIETLALEVLLKLGIVLTLMAVTEQPMYVALILRNLGYTHMKWWYGLCSFAGWFFLVTKSILAVLAVCILMQSLNEKEKSWVATEHSFSEWNTDGFTISPTTFTTTLIPVICLLLSVQLYTGVALLRIAGSVRQGNGEKKTTEGSKEEAEEGSSTKEMMIPEFSLDYSASIDA